MPPPLCLVPPRLTQHALERLDHWGFSRDEVVAAIENPELTHDHEDPTLRVAVAGRVRVPYNPTTGEVVTVMPRKDTDLDQEQPMSGWINLDARQAEKLLQDWGFEIHSQKNNANLWEHPLARGTLIPFAIPARGARANGKTSFRTAAHAVGRSVSDFLKGPDDDFKARLAVIAAADEALVLATGPDPLGINRKIGMDRLEKLGKVADALVHGEPTPLPTATETPTPPEPAMPAYTPAEEKVLAGLLEAPAPVTARELSRTLGIHDVTARDGLRKAVKLGDAFVVGKRRRHGAPADTFWYEATYTEPVPEPATAPEPAPIPTPEPIQETPVPDATVVDLPTPPTTKEKLFTATGTPWPTGGILIQDEDGVFYVARKLVEEGR